LYATILQNMPVAGFYGVFGNKFSHYYSPGSANKSPLYPVSNKASVGITVYSVIKFLFPSMTHQRDKINDFRKLK